MKEQSETEGGQAAKVGDAASMRTHGVAGSAMIRQQPLTAKRKEPDGRRVLPAGANKENNAFTVTRGMHS